MNREGAPFVDGRRDRDASTASLHQAEDQGEADAAAFERARGALYAMETLEDGFEVAFANADAGVGDGDAGARGVETDRDLDRAGQRVLESVAEQVEGVSVSAEAHNKSGLTREG